MLHSLRFFAGVVLTLILLELVFQILPVSTATNTGYYIDPKILTYPPNFRFTMSTGWDLKNTQHHKTNNYGFLADRDFSYDPRALGLIGDSFVEANMLPAGDRLAAQLENKLGGRPVFALGGPGSSLLDYAERIRFAHENFGISEFIVVLERGDIKQGLCGSGNNHGPCLDPKTLTPKVELQTPADWKKKIIRKSALAQYIFSQLKMNPATSLKKLTYTPPSFPQAVAEPDKMDAIAHAVTELFFQKIQFEKAIQLTFLIDSERTKLFNDLAQNDIGLDIFKTYAQDKGAKVISPITEFREYRKKTGLILEVGPYDAHWNREAIRILTTVLE